MEEKISGIYCIENLVNGKKYIGLSSNINKREKAHFNALNNYSHINKHLQDAWNKYKEENFKFYIIENCESTEQLKEREIYYINIYNTNNRLYGYNKTSGGDGVRDLSDESREKISIGESLDDILQIDNRGNIINIFRNCRMASEYFKKESSKENIRSCCNKKYGYKTAFGYYWMYKKDYESNGFNLIKYKPSDNTCNVKSILQYDLNNNFIAEYKSARECERQTGIGYKLISRVCNGNRPHTHGYIFKFKLTLN